MDLEFLTPEQLEMTLKLSDILSMEDLTVAAAVLASYDWNIETALNEMQFGALPQPQNTYTQAGSNAYQSEQEENYFEEENAYEIERQTLDGKKKYFEEEHPSLVPLQHTLSEPTNLYNFLEHHKKIAQDSTAHRGDYLLALMKKSEHVCQHILDSNPESKRKYTQNRQKIENNRQFINNLYKNYQPRINFTFGTFFLNLIRSFLEEKHLLVYIHSLNPETQSKYDRVISLILRQKEISSFVNQNCITYGMFDNSDDYEVLQKYVTPRELPAFAVFRMNKSTRQEEFVSSYVVSTQKDIFLEWLADSIGFKLKRRDSEAKEKNIAQKVEAKAETIKPKENYNAHAYLRAQQDELYYELEKTYNQKRQLSLDRREKIKEDEQNLQMRIKAAEQEKEPQDGPEIIEVRFRMPLSGESRSRRFHFNDKVEKGFVFVDCFCRDDFEEKFNNFELIQTHPSLILGNFKEKTFGEVFEGSRRQNVMVREV